MQRDACGESVPAWVMQLDVCTLLAAEVQIPAGVTLGAELLPLTLRPPFALRPRRVVVDVRRLRALTGQAEA